ncbi:hypothetical protein KIN20_015438 [Parelaphostrongylus tenuis]|uniref:Uncharacterized protein n=1 Tax=Parelaphostrongylus tenuis TaxID=148309 RepID=A0AAD5QP07_PARTN|nr:hypothetical protein KIN20_015438 [Parelaphostrongylus tenuis]
MVSTFYNCVESIAQASTTVDINHSRKPSAKCEFSVHKDGPDGERVTGTISTDEPGFKPYPMIDENGCSLEPSLYDDYLSKFTAGIRNPYPVRFRSSSGAVILYCVTTLEPTTLTGACSRYKLSIDDLISKALSLVRPIFDTSQPLQYDEMFKKQEVLQPPKEVIVRQRQIMAARRMIQQLLAQFDQLPRCLL